MKVVLYSLRKQEEVQTISGMFDVLKLENALWWKFSGFYRPHVEWINEHQCEVWIVIRKKDRRKVVEIIEGCRV